MTVLLPWVAVSGCHLGKKHALGRDVGRLGKRKKGGVKMPDGWSKVINLAN